MNCPHARTETWRRGAYSPKGPERFRATDGTTYFRSWTNCLDCGIRLERGSQAPGDPPRSK